MGEQKLYEMDHPYYCSEGNYFNSDCHTEWDSWQSFFREYGDTDPDLNLIFRWDWRDGEYETPKADHKGMEYLYIYVVGQRKARLESNRIAVRREEEPEIRAWLEKRLETIKAIWQPLLP